MKRIKKNDTVMVIAGRDKGKTGKVLRVVDGGARLIVEKANLVKRHQRPTQQYPQGGIIEKEAAIHASNVMLVSPTTGEPFRVQSQLTEEDGKKQRSRYNAKSDELVP